MITRFCFVRLAGPHADDAGRGAATAVVRRLAALPALTVTVGVPADATAAKWDLAITIAAASLAELAAAMTTPTWLAVDADLAARAVVIKAWHFVAAT